MTNSQLKSIIREIVKEEIYRELPDMLAEIIGGMTPKVASKPKPKSKSANHTPTLVEALNEQAPSMTKEQVRAMLRAGVQIEGGEFRMGTDAVPMTPMMPTGDISAEDYEGMMNSGMMDLPMAPMPVSAASSANPSVARALTRNYSDLMKRLK